MIRMINWSSYQSYKDRKPPWIRLHRSLVDNYEFQTMSSNARALLPMLWLLACENENPVSGEIPYSPQKISFRLRLPLKEINATIKEIEIAGFLVTNQPCSETVTKPLQDSKLTVTPETETETETETDHKEHCASNADALLKFETFWAVFDYKKGKAPAIKSWNKIKLTDDLFNTILNGAAREAKNRPFLDGKNQTPKMAQGWLTEKRWEDEHEESQQPTAIKEDSTLAMLRKNYGGKEDGSMANGFNDDTVIEIACTDASSQAVE